MQAKAGCGRVVSTHIDMLIANAVFSAAAPRHEERQDLLVAKHATKAHKAEVAFGLVNHSSFVQHAKELEAVAANTSPKRVSHIVHSNRMLEEASSCLH